MGEVIDIAEKARGEAAKAADDVRRKERERAKKARYRTKKRGGGNEQPQSTLAVDSSGHSPQSNGGHGGVDSGGQDVDNHSVHVSPGMSPPVSPETATRIIYEDGVPAGIMNKGGRYRLFNDNAEKELVCRKFGVDPNPPKPDPENSDVLSPVLSPRLSPVHHPPEREFEELTLSLGRADVHRVDTVEMSTKESGHVSTMKSTQGGDHEHDSTSNSDPNLMTQAPAWAVAMEARLLAEVGALREQTMARLDGLAVHLRRVSEAQEAAQPVALPTVKTIDAWLANHDGTLISGAEHASSSGPPSWPEADAEGDHPTPVMPAPSPEPVTTTSDDINDDVVAGLDLTYTILAAWMLVSGQREDDITLPECDLLAEVHAHAAALVAPGDAEAAFDLYMHWLSLTDVPAGEAPKAEHVYAQLAAFPKSVPVEHESMPELRWTGARASFEHQSMMASSGVTVS